VHGLPAPPLVPAVSREIHGTTVTSDGHDLQVQPAGPSAPGGDPGARRLGIRTGLEQADIITGGPEPEPSR
jgi:hypothetical protein